MLIVSLAANYHDSSVAVADERQVLAVLEAERFSRRKKQWCNRAAFESLVTLALSAAGRTLDEVTHWCGSAMGNVLLPPESRSCAWTREETVRLLGRDVPFLAVNHHLAHAASFFASPFESAVIDACDGGGDGRQHVAYRARWSDGRATIEELPGDDDRQFTGVFYDVCSYYLYRRYCQEGKFMGLAAYGRLDERAHRWLVDQVPALSAQPHEVSFAQLHRRFGLERFDPGDQRCRDFARTVQAVFESERVRQVSPLATLDRNLVLCGGSALNIHANTAIRQSLPAHALYVAPCCDDTGEALGALLYLACVVLGVRPRVPLPFVGLAAAPEAAELDDAVASRVVEDLLGGRVVAWHWGRAEIGPRALGHRSLLCVPFTREHAALVSQRVKGREPYRPVAPIVLANRLADFFSGDRESPYMLFASDARERAATMAPAIVHADGTARIQTIDESHVLGKVLRLLDEAAGVPMLINTSLNGPGEPIVQTHAETLAFCQHHPEVVPYLDGRRQHPA